MQKLYLLLNLDSEIQRLSSSKENQRIQILFYFILKIESFDFINKVLIFVINYHFSIRLVWVLGYLQLRIKLYQICQPSYMQFQIFSEKIEFSKLNLKIEFHEPLNGSWKVLGCNTGHDAMSNKKHRLDLRGLSVLSYLLEIL